MNDGEDDGDESQDGGVETGDDIDGEPVLRLPSGRFYIDWNGEIIFANSVAALEDEGHVRKARRP